ncbi:dihydrolipoamide acetyltransferase family protein [Castellaniella denitrificans]|uniref:Dihydrolipoamide acetyltransferase component of pyruvate dehydrogenase complex n=1 Tax=Castellaniella denitrificans TaxID=56119 RepID=A0ABT4M7I3_9BURK|nr:2-oxo acid dehydrogenase subunit E2 [Castellaniella denitrificans]MCZ4331198.1 2-oxo acid dehydrogenase subunit E2 [Castellaniella denitrificans]
MGIHIIKMPDIGEGIAEVELVEWHVQAGDAVVEDQILADVMTDKATVQVPSPVHGRVMSLGGKVGDVMAVGSELIRLEVEGEGNEGTVGATSRAASVTEPVAVSAPDVPEPAPASRPESAESRPAGRAAVPAASERESAPVSAARGAMAPHAASHAPSRPEGQRPLASPAVRRRAWDLGITLQYVPGTGPAGRITHGDLDAWLARDRNATSNRTTGALYAAQDQETQIPVIGLRRKIAQKMQEAKRRIPHFTYVEEIDVTELESLRARLNALHSAERGKLTLLPFLARAMVLSLREFPQINARYDDDAGVVTQYGAVHLGVAAQTPSGLMVPVLHHAETLDLWSCAAEVARLAEAARQGKAARDELSGSTITLTSLGALGGIVSTPVINHPEVAIVGVNRVVERPVFQEGRVVARKLMNLSSSFDHRVVDGMHAAEFIQCIRRYLECPALLFVE